MVEEEKSAPEANPYLNKANKLYEKYVMVGAEFEINLEYAKRNAFDHLIYNSRQSKMSEVELVQLLIELFAMYKEQMNKLLCFSLSRFKLDESTCFIQMKHILNTPNIQL